MNLRTKHIAVTFSLSLLLIPSIYGMERLETPVSSENSNNTEKDFDYFLKKNIVCLVETLFSSYLTKIPKEEINPEGFEIVKETFNHPPYLSEFNNAVKATSNLNINSTFTEACDVTNLWRAYKWNAIYKVWNGLSKPTLNDLTIAATLEILANIEGAPSQQLVEEKCPR